MTDHPIRRRRRPREGDPGAPETANAAEETPGPVLEPESGEERALAGYPPVAPARETTSPTSTPLLGAPPAEELSDDAPRRVPGERNALGEPTETIEAVDRTAAEHWDARLWKRHR